MPGTESLSYHNTVAVLTSMHAKERVIGPILQDELGLIVGLATGVDTDKFGTFSREVERNGSPLDAARAKIAAGFEYAPSARVGLARSWTLDFPLRARASIPSSIKPQRRFASYENKVALPQSTVSRPASQRRDVEQIKVVTVEILDQLLDARCATKWKKPSFHEGHLNARQDIGCALKRDQFMPLQIELQQYSVVEAAFGGE